MSAAEPKVGDRVRCTHGESVLVGTVSYLSTARGALCVDIGSSVTDIAIRRSGWIVEILCPPVPDVVGTIVRDRFGIAWQRDPSGWSCRAMTDWSLAELLDTYGPLEVLHTPGAAA